MATQSGSGFYKNSGSVGATGHRVQSSKGYSNGYTSQQVPETRTSQVSHTHNRSNGNMFNSSHDEKASMHPGHKQSLMHNGSSNNLSASASQGPGQSSSFSNANTKAKLLRQQAKNAVLNGPTCSYSGNQANG